MMANLVRFEALLSGGAFSANSLVLWGLFQVLGWSLTVNFLNSPTTSTILYL